MLYVLKAIYNTLFIPPGIFLSLLLALAARTYRSQRKTAVFLFAFTILFIFAPYQLLPIQLYHKYRLPILVSGGKVLETSGTEAEL